MHGNLHRPRCFTCARPFDYPPGIPEEPEGGDRLVQPLRAWLGVEHHTGCGLLHRGGGGNIGGAAVRDIQHGPGFAVHHPALHAAAAGQGSAWTGGGGRALDNIFVERLWRTVKYEHVYLQEIQTIQEAWSGLREFFSLYNNERFHQSLDYRTPAQVYLGRGQDNEAGTNISYSCFTPRFTAKASLTHQHESQTQPEFTSLNKNNS